MSRVRGEDTSDSTDTVLQIQTMSPQTSLLLSSMAMVTLVCVVIMSYHGHGLQNYNDNITEIVLANDQGRFDASQTNLATTKVSVLPQVEP